MVEKKKKEGLVLLPKVEVIGAMWPELLRHLTRKYATVLYPFERKGLVGNVPKGFRGKLKYDEAKCIGCMLCARDCPAGAIEKVSTGISAEKAKDKSLPPEKRKKFKPKFYLDRCIRCGQCIEACPKGAIELTEIFEVAGYSREELRV